MSFEWRRFALEMQKERNELKRNVEILETGLKKEKEARCLEREDWERKVNNLRTRLDQQRVQKAKLFERKTKQAVAQERIRVKENIMKSWKKILDNDELGIEIKYGLRISWFQW